VIIRSPLSGSNGDDAILGLDGAVYVFHADTSQLILKKFLGRALVLNLIIDEINGMIFSPGPFTRPSPSQPFILAMTTYDKGAWLAINNTSVPDSATVPPITSTSASTSFFSSSTGLLMNGGPSISEILVFVSFVSVFGVLVVIYGGKPLLAKINDRLGSLRLNQERIRLGKTLCTRFGEKVDFEDVFCGYCGKKVGIG
jgi:hypothetical protein